MPDALDEDIVELLVEDARLSHREIARRLGTSQPTVTSRIRRLEEGGVIQGYTIRLRGEPVPSAPVGIAVHCHWCKSSTTRPLWQTIGGREHPFCCPTCRHLFATKHEELSKDL